MHTFPLRRAKGTHLCPTDINADIDAHSDKDTHMHAGSRQVDSSNLKSFNKHFKVFLSAQNYNIWQVH